MMIATRGPADGVALEDGPGDADSMADGVGGATVDATDGSSRGKTAT
jgi:hypothetical protein